MPLILYGEGDIPKTKYQKEQPKAERRGPHKSSHRIEGFEESMQVSIKWNEFLKNAKTKEELINIIAKFIKSNRARQLIYSPFIVITKARDKIYRFKRFKTK